MDEVLTPAGYLEIRKRTDPHRMQTAFQTGVENNS